MDYGEVLIPIVAIVSVFGSATAAVYLFFSTRYRIRMALIENDKTAEIFRSYQDRPNALKYGLVAIMVGIGILVGYILEQTGMDAFVAYCSMVLILGGAGLLIYYRWGGRGAYEV